MVEKKHVKTLTNPLEHHLQKPLFRQTLGFLTSLNSMDEPAFILLVALSITDALRTPSFSVL
jgi:hypothetical protein